MINLPPKPPGSIVEVQQSHNSVVLSWKSRQSGGCMRYGVLIFLLAWMGGWVLGETSAVRALLKGDGGAFLLFWLVGWTVGGIFCATMIYRLARPSRPERVTLELLHLIHQPAIEPANIFSWHDKESNLFEIFKPRKIRRMAKQEIGEIRIDRVGERQRLSLDYAAKRIEIGASLEEPEREWLFSVLQTWKSA